MSELKRLLLVGTDSVQEVKIDLKYLAIFQQELARILTAKGWRRVSTEIMKITPNGLEIIKNVELWPNNYNIFDTSPEQDSVFIFSFQKSMYEFLEVKTTIEEGKILISWNRKISPSIGKSISIVTVVLLVISAIMRLMIPIESIIPMTIFIVGIAGNLIFLLIIIYFYDRSLENNRDEHISFMETLVFVSEFEKLASKM